MWVGQMVVMANMMHNPTQPRQRASMASWQSGLGRSSPNPAPTKLFFIIVVHFCKCEAKQWQGIYQLKLHPSVAAVHPDKHETVAIMNSLHAKQFYFSYGSGAILWQS